MSGSYLSFLRIATHHLTKIPSFCYCPLLLALLLMRVSFVPEVFAVGKKTTLSKHTSRKIMGFFSPTAFFFAMHVPHNTWLATFSRVHITALSCCAGETASLPPLKQIFVLQAEFSLSFTSATQFTFVLTLAEDFINQLEIYFYLLSLWACLNNTPGFPCTQQHWGALSLVGLLFAGLWDYHTCPNCFL